MKLFTPRSKNFQIKTARGTGGEESTPQIFQNKNTLGGKK